MKIKTFLTQSVTSLLSFGAQVTTRLAQARTAIELEDVRKQVIAFRNQYVQVETTIHLYTDAINSRTTPSVSALMRACDVLCMQSMQELLGRVNNQPVPAVLTYIDKGLGLRF
ncbi:hypothetical protein [Spirosoma telluris]|uniref:hypothetical protein n=1 Tax=Spirosoma telluris TaxID=2183553 RepID=UPI0018DB5A25